MVALVFALLTYLAATAGVDAWYRSQDVETSGGAQLPRVLYNAPESVATTGQRGPVGPVAVVFAGTTVLDGLVGELDPPWIAVSSRTGDYRAIDAPDLPPAEPHAISVSPDGERLAWAAEDRIVVHDAVTGESRVLQAPGVTAVGAFAPDGERLLVLAGELRVIDVVADEQVAALGEVPARAVDQAAWRPDGSAVSLVDGRLVEIDVASGRRTPSTVAVSAHAQLAWSPSGRRLVTLQEMSGVQRLQVWDRAADGTVTPGRSVPVEGIAMRRLLGPTDEASVAVTGLALETGVAERIFAASLAGGNLDEIGQMPAPGDNWAGGETLAVASDALARGSTRFEEPRWPWSYLAKLVMSLVLAGFGLGMYLTRRPRR